MIKYTSPSQQLPIYWKQKMSLNQDATFLEGELIALANWAIQDLRVLNKLAEILCITLQLVVNYLIFLFCVFFYYHSWVLNYISTNVCIYTLKTNNGASCSLEVLYMPPTNGLVKAEKNDWPRDGPRPILVCGRIGL